MDFENFAHLKSVLLSKQTTMNIKKYQGSDLWGQERCLYWYEEPCRRETHWECPLTGIPPTQGSLLVLEVDPLLSLAKFKRVAHQLIRTRNQWVFQINWLILDSSRISEIWWIRLQRNPRYECSESRDVQQTASTGFWRLRQVEFLMQLLGWLITIAASSAETEIAAAISIATWKIFYNADQTEFLVFFFKYGLRLAVEASVWLLNNLTFDISRFAY